MLGFYFMRYQINFRLLSNITRITSLLLLRLGDALKDCLYISSTTNEPYSKYIRINFILVAPELCLCFVLTGGKGGGGLSFKNIFWKGIENPSTVVCRAYTFLTLWILHSPSAYFLCWRLFCHFLIGNMLCRWIHSRRIYGQSLLTFTCTKSLVTVSSATKTWEVELP